MNLRKNKCFILTAFAGLIALFAAGCGEENKPHTIEPAFYYWKSQAVFNGTEEATLKKLSQKLYVKFFDVVWDPQRKEAGPVAKVQFGTKSRQFLSENQIRIIPTVFITNETLRYLDSGTTVLLASRLAALIENTAKEQLPDAPVSEVQIDCDWTAQTRDKYFLLLQHIKQYPWIQGKTLSATIRLYQCKYMHRTGVPPVDRGLLMCYNMGNLKDPATTNSILDPKELELYTSSLNRYPLELDVAFPLFNWKVLFRQDKYTGLIQDLPTAALDVPGLTNRKGNTYRLLKDTLLLGYELHKDDLIRQEDSNFDDIMKSARILKPKIRNEKLTVSLYHLDSLTLNNYTTYELQTILSSLH
ncbi:hypothetical protein HHL16_06220 [Pseudoflavitalea sp. G-6-1-2]|uniref:hypothetical protein n=1 Tax=Pseudoflavitalea sp. G-6-1-2 TaxID=2728841 RepID=UPI00146D3B43|nr:hypothetical protein [Pseudoflavitalea sp. G-6-1-2]NML20459.1 hypothetical protein [Pseudoflavitalea sp. G-6-1-2]